MTAVSILFPPGRIVQGTPGRFTESKANGVQPAKVYKSGEHMGQPLRSWFFALAIPKQPGQTHWAQKVLPAGVQPGSAEADMYAWGEKIWQIGAAAFPQLYQGRDFAWKVEDGDDTSPNKRGRKNCDSEGMPGHWIVKFNTSAWQGIRCYRREGGQYVQMNADEIKTGHYVQVRGSVEGNGVKVGTSDTPGVYMNPDLVLWVGFGPEILTGPDPDEAFGGVNVALPAGASAVPLGVAAIPVAAPAAPGVPGVPGAPALPMAPVAAPVAAPPTMVPPNPAFLGVAPAAAPVAPLAPAVPAVPAAPHVPQRQMTPKAAGATYEMFVAQKWTDEMLISQGYMVMV